MTVILTEHEDYLPGHLDQLTFSMYSLGWVKAAPPCVVLDSCWRWDAGQIQSLVYMPVILAWVLRSTEVWLSVEFLDCS